MNQMNSPLIGQQVSWWLDYESEVSIVDTSDFERQRMPLRLKKLSQGGKRMEPVQMEGVVVWIGEAGEAGDFGMNLLVWSGHKLYHVEPHAWCSWAGRVRCVPCW